MAKSKPVSPRDYVESLLKIISQGLYEKDQILAIALLCAISGESLFLLGPPGTAKSEVSRRLKLIFRDARAFEYLMSRFSTPDEIFGPVSIRKLKSEDTYERKVEGFLPDATIVFLDEIWKAGPAIQNALLTVINEKIYQNGTNTLHVPMKCLIAASNELPAENEGLEALWDRFLVRVVSNCIEDEKTFYRMLCMPEMPDIKVPEELLLTDERYQEWQQAMTEVTVPQEILAAFTAIRKSLAEASKEDGISMLDYYISDRRWRKIVRLLRASAFLNGRTAIDFSDMLLLYHTLWNNADCIEPVLTIVSKATIADVASLTAEIEKECEAGHQALVSKNEEEELSQYRTFEYFYLGLQNHPRGTVFFNKSDYKYIPQQGECNGVMYFDQAKSAYIIRHFDKNMRAFETSGKQNVTAVKLRKGIGYLIVDGQAFSFVRSGKSSSSDTIPELQIFSSPLIARIDEAKELLRMRYEAIKGSKNLFVSTDDLRLVNKQVKVLDKRLDIARVKATNL